MLLRQTQAFVSFLIFAHKSLPSLGNVVHSVPPEVLSRLSSTFLTDRYNNVTLIRRRAQFKSFVMNSKKTGRPRGFDELTALNAAMNVFWAKGYHGSSLQDLTDAMGINRPSLYGSFGDKRQLYLKAIENYVSNHARKQMVAFETEVDIAKAVRAFMKITINSVTPDDGGPRGCFLASGVATSAGEVDGAAELLQGVLRDTERKLATRFDAEREKGTLPKDFPSLERAQLMYDLSLGHALRARAGISRGTLAKNLDHQVKIILA